MKSICNSTPEEKDEAISVILMASFPANFADFRPLVYDRFHFKVYCFISMQQKTYFRPLFIRL